MKTIQVSDETYEFLMNLSKELNTQDHRATAMPYFFQVQDEEEISVGQGQGEEGWYCDGTVITTEEEIKEAIFEYKDWEIGNEEHEKQFAEIDWLDKEMILEENYRKVYVSTQKVYTNAFLTEKACKKHIESNGHHYHNPMDYLSYASRNPELEMLLKFLYQLTSGDEMNVNNNKFMRGILEKKENGWFVRWSDLHSFTYGTHWMWTPLRSTEVIDETKYKDGDEVEFEMVISGYDVKDFTPFGHATLKIKQIN